jgi:hypothetical protein
MWVGRIDPRLKTLIEDAEKAGESAVEAMTRAAYAGLPEGVADVLIRGLRASAASGLASDRARKRRALSRMVYRQAAFHGDKLEQVIREGIISGLSARELAKDAYEYVSPTTKGGASYAAMRLARTEINNALHERQLAGAKRPGVKAAKWNLSGSHRVPDLCNVYASHGGNGHWAPDNIPDKPHPQCFCYLTYITQSPEAFIRKLEDGGFDDEIDRRTKENMARLGQPVGVVDKPKPAPKPRKRTAKPKPKAPSPFDAPPPSPFDPPPERPAWFKDSPFQPGPRPAVAPSPRTVVPSRTKGIIPEHGRVEVPDGPVPEAVRKMQFKVDESVNSRMKAKFMRVMHIQHGYVGDRIGIAIGEFRMGRPDGSMGRNTTANFRYADRSLAMKSTIEKEEYTRQLARGHKCGWHPKGGDDPVETTIAHETGHALIAEHRFRGVMIPQMMGELARIYGLSTPPDTRPFGDNSLTLRMLMKKWLDEPENVKIVKSKISQYAATSINELMAEVWSDYTMNPNPSEETRMMGEVLQSFITQERQGLMSA